MNRTEGASERGRPARDGQLEAADGPAGDERMFREGRKRGREAAQAPPRWRLRPRAVVRLILCTLRRCWLPTISMPTPA